MLIHQWPIIKNNEINESFTGLTKILKKYILWGPSMMSVNFELFGRLINPNQSCSVSKETFDLYSYNRDALIRQSISTLALLNKLFDQSVPLVTVRSIVSLLTEQL